MSSLVLRRQMPETRATTPTSPEWWFMDIQDINPNSRVIVMSPCHKEPLIPDRRSKVNYRRFRIDGVFVHAQWFGKLSWSDATFADYLASWRRGEWRKVDLRKKENRK